MRLLLQFSILFVIMMAGILEVFLCFATIKEFQRRKTDRHLLLVAVFFGLLAIANLTDVSSRFLQAQGLVEFGNQIAALPTKFNLIGTVIIALVFGFLYVQDTRRRNFFWGFVTVAGLVAVMTWSQAVSRQVFGINVPAGSLQSFLTTHAVWMLLNIVMAALAGRAWYRGRQRGDKTVGADLYLIIGGLLSVVMAITIAVLLWLDLESAASAIYLLLMGAACFRFLGLIAKRHPETSIRENPFTLVTGRILFRLLTLVGVFFSVFAFLLMFLVANQMIGQLQKEHSTHIEHSLLIASRIAYSQYETAGRPEGYVPERNVINETCRYGGSLPISGCGWINFRDETVTLNRESTVNPDDMAKQLMTMIRTGSGQSLSGLNGGSWFYLQIPTGDAPGSLFAVVTQADMDKETLRLLSLISVWTFAFMALMFFLLYRVVEIPLHPLKPLQIEAERLESGLEPGTIGIEYPDEIGKLSETFNRMAMAIKKRTEELSDKIREQRDFIAFTVHELKAPLSAFRWTLEIIETDGEKMTPQQKELTVILTEASGKMQGLVNDLLSVSRLERGKIEIELHQISLQDIIRKSCTALRPLAENRRIAINYDDGGTDRLLAVGDADLLLHSLDNYLTNAIKFSRLGGQVNITASRTDNGRSILVAVKDGGIGITKNDQGNIFSLFFRATNAKDSGIDGSGLGLNITKRFIELHNGRVWFESEEGKGSTFYFQIPVNGPHQPSTNLNRPNGENPAKKLG